MAPPANIVGSTAGPFVNLAQCPAATNPVTGAGLQEGYQAMMDNAAFLNADKLSKSLGGTVAAAVTFSAAVALNSASSTLGASSVITAAKGAQIAGEIEFPAAAIVDMYARTRIAGSDSLSDTNHQLVMGTTKQSVQ